MGPEVRGYRHELLPAPTPCPCDIEDVVHLCRPPSCFPGLGCGFWLSIHFAFFCLVWHSLLGLFVEWAPAFCPVRHFTLDYTLWCHFLSQIPFQRWTERTALFYRKCQCPFRIKAWPFVRWQRRAWNEQSWDVPSEWKFLLGPKAFQVGPEIPFYLCS